RCAAGAWPGAASGTARPRPGTAGTARRGAARPGRAAPRRRRWRPAPRTAPHTARRSPPLGISDRTPSLPAREELVAQLLPGTVKAHLRRRLGDAQLGSDRLVRELVHVPQADDGPQAGREPVERVVAVAAPPPEVRRRAVGRDPVHPGGELRVAPEPPQAPIGPQVGLLDDVAGVLLVTRQSVGERVGVGVGRAHQLLERGTVAVAGRRDELGGVARALTWHRQLRPPPPVGGYETIR